MKHLLSIILLSWSFHFVVAQDNPLRIVMVGAHPDDCDIRGAGTAALFAQMGHKVKFISVTNGNAGHMEQGGGILAKRRRAEADEVAKRLGITYDIMDNHDGELMPTLDIRLELIRKIRAWNADVVISHRPVDYHPDHRYTGILVQDAAFMVMVPNIAADVPPLTKNPVFLYFEDRFTKPSRFQPDVCVDITQVMDKKLDALDAHESQFYEWLPWVAGYKGEIPKGKQERKDWLRSTRFPSIDSTVRAGLEKWYGARQAKAARYAEAFELCEYGTQPSEKEIKRLFPMLKEQ